ncbi:hypothetical protein SprV_0401533400 [Sparganum proliferum]
MDAHGDERPGIRIAYRTDGQLLNQWRMHFRSRVSTTDVHEHLFADDCTLNATSECDMHRNMNFYATACDDFGLVFSTEKAVVKDQPPTDAAYVAPQINVHGAQPQAADNFTYLGTIFSQCQNRR